MVFTRNQKRNIDEIVDQSKNDVDNKRDSENIHITNEYSNLNLNVKRRKTDNEVDDSNTSDESYIDNSDDNNISYESDNSDSLRESSISEIVLDIVEDSDDNNEDNIEDDIDNNSEEYIGEMIDLTKEKRRKRKLRMVVPITIDSNTFDKLNLDNVNKSSAQTEKQNDDQSDNKSESYDPEDLIYNRFIKYVDKIHSGEFFRRIPPEDKLTTVKKKYTVEQIESINQKLNKLQELYKNNAPSIIDILNMDVADSFKTKMLEKMHHYTNSEILTSEYNSHIKYLMTNINKTQDQELYKLEQEIIKCSQSDEYSDDYRKKILMSQMSFNNKVIAYKRYEVMERYQESDSSEYAKYKNWMDILLSIPFGKYISLPSDNTSEFIKQVRQTLDKRLSFLEKPKDQIINVVTQMIRNPDFTINAIGLHGTKGTGKSSIVKSIAEALNRPFKMISLGGESDSSILSGHNFTYIGSMPGRIIEILNESKCMNPVVLIDEIDKISQTHQGKEIIGNLIHLTDKTTNLKYNYDRYFSGIEFDLSKVLFIFTYNDPEKVDRILADRLYKIHIDNYTISEKLQITNNHIINDILSEYRFSDEEIRFEPDAINYIVNDSRSDEGMRDIKRKFEIIVSRINTLLLTDKNENVIKLKYKELYNQYNQLPITVLKEHVDILLKDSISSDTKWNDPPPGMYT